MTLHAIPSGASVLASRAMLARPTISVWTARKFDRRVTADVVADHGAAADAGRWNKSLIARDALADVTRAAGAFRADHYSMTLPWSDEGSRILPVTLHSRYAERERKARAEFEAAASAFVASYPQYVDDARRRLNGMFVATDYPSPAEIAKRFAFRVDLFPVPAGSDFRVDVGDAVRAAVEDRVREATAAAMADACKRIAGVVGTMAEKLATYRPAANGAAAEGVFRDSLIGNVRELADVLPAFNLTGSPAFDALAAAVATLAKPEPETLRADDTLRREAAATAARLAAEADALASDASAFF